MSAADATAILAYANTATQAALWDVVRTEPDTVAPLLVSQRPYTTLQQLVDVSGVGPSRSARCATPRCWPVRPPGRQGQQHPPGRDDQHELRLVRRGGDQPGQQHGIECFGVPDALVNGLRPDPAEPGHRREVWREVTDAVNFANRYGEVGSADGGARRLSRR